MQRKIQEQKQVLQQRNVLLEALAKNFAVLKTLCHNQKEENRFYKKQNLRLKGDNAYMQSKLQELERRASATEKENLRMREAEGRVRKIVEENQFMKVQMESLNRQLDRKLKELGEADFQLKLAKAENLTLKKEIGELDDRYRDDMKQFRAVEEKAQAQQTLLMKLQALSDEQREHLLEHEARVAAL